MKILCIGRNYKEHVRELNSPLPSEPVFFLKPETSLLTGDKPFELPAFSEMVHYEVELVIRISKTGKNIPEKEAAGYYDAITVGLDFTARDIQEQCKKKGLPWLISKGFDQSAPLAEFVPKNRFPDTRSIGFHLDLNGKTVQRATSAEMIFPFESVISYISRFITLQPGDVIYTGTPSGVGPVKSGDLLEAYLGNNKLLTCPIK